MTPFELNLANELEAERNRFGNEWLSKWHNLNKEGGTVDVPSFDGGRFTVSGVRFEGWAELNYWRSIGRYLDGVAHETFQRWAQQTSSYPIAVRLSSLDGTEKLLRWFLAKTVNRAQGVDDVLRGRDQVKVDFPPESSGYYVKAAISVQRLALAHRNLLESAVAKEPSLSYSKRLEDFYANNKGLIWIGGIVGSAIVATVGALLKRLTD
jgi:hypothetical protein